MRWYIRFKGDFYAGGPIILSREAESEEEAGALIMEFFNWEELPEGFEYWRARNEIKYPGRET